MQGYLFAKPMSADQVPGFIAGRAEGEVGHGSMAAEAKVATG
jgi:hypothetical protein